MNNLNKFVIDNNLKINETRLFVNALDAEYTGLFAGYRTKEDNFHYENINEDSLLLLVKGYVLEFYSSQIGKIELL